MFSEGHLSLSFLVSSDVDMHKPKNIKEFTMLCMEEYKNHNCVLHRALYKRAGDVILCYSYIAM